MFRANRLGVLLAIVILLSGGLAAACGGGDDDDDDDGGNGAEANPTVEAAQAVYAELDCAECHGENGAGDGESEGTALVGTRMIIGQFRTRIRNGRGSAMPGYTEEQITDENIELLFEWFSNAEPA